MSDNEEPSAASGGSVANHGARLAALEELVALDQKLELEYGLTGNPMIKAQGRTSPTQTTPGECSKPREGTEPVAWAVTMGDGSVYEAFAAHQHGEAVELARRCMFGTSGPLPLAPLYRQPPCQDLSQKNLTLTDAEREAISAAYDFLCDRARELQQDKRLEDSRPLVQLAKTLQGLWDRTQTGRK